MNTFAQSHLATAHSQANDFVTKNAALSTAAAFAEATMLHILTLVLLLSGD